MEVGPHAKSTTIQLFIVTYSEFGKCIEHADGLADLHSIAQAIADWQDLRNQLRMIDEVVIEVAQRES